jgi:hypothetical protein
MIQQQRVSGSAIPKEKKNVIVKPEMSMAAR